MRNRDHRVNGTFRPGENAPVNTGHLCQTFRNPAFSTQVELTVGAYGESDTRLIWLQVRRFEWVMNTDESPWTMDDHKKNK